MRLEIRKRKSVQIRYCKWCGDPIPREMYTPSKYRERVWCSDPCKDKSTAQAKVDRKVVDAARDYNRATGRENRCSPAMGKFLSGAW